MILQACTLWPDGHCAADTVTALRLERGKRHNSQKCFFLSGNPKLPQNPQVCLFLTGQIWVKRLPKLWERLGGKVYSIVTSREVGILLWKWETGIIDVDNSFCLPQRTKIIDVKVLICKMHVEEIFPLLAAPEVGAVEDD